MPKKTFTEPEIRNLEQQTHVALTPWVEKHVTDSSFEGLSALPYDRSAYPFQRLDRAYTRARWSRVPWLPKRVVMSNIESALVGQIGQNQTHKLIDTFQNTSAGPDSDLSVAEDVAARIDNHETVSVIVDHLKQGDLRDLALVMAGLLRATEEPDMRKRAAIVIGKNISRQALSGVPIAKRLSKVGGIIWVMQATGNRGSYKVPKDAVRVVNDGAKQAIEKLAPKGLLLGVVPSGTTMEKSKDKPERYRRPDVAFLTSAMLSNTDAILPTGYYSGEALTGPVFETDFLGDYCTLNNAYGRLAQFDADLTGLPVEYERTDGTIVTAQPE